MLFDAIQSSTKVGIFSHVNPDGDAIGSTLALAGYLEAIGKPWRIFYPTAVSESLNFMIPECSAGRITVWDASAPKGKYRDDQYAEVFSCDLLVGLDFNAIDRIREWGEPFMASTAYKILVDHHVGPQSEYFNEVYSRTDVSSTCELLYSLLGQFPGVDGDASALPDLSRRSLLTGMTTDTNNFANSVFPGTLTMASELLAAGTPRDEIIQNLFFRYPLRRLEAEGYLICNNLKITPEGVAYIILDRRVQNRFHLQEGDTEGFVNKALSVDEVKMSILVKQERSTPLVRISIRSKAGWSARQMALRYFHGGGHELASGGRLTIGVDVPNMREVENYLRQCIKDFTEDAKV